MDGIRPTVPVRPAQKNTATHPLDEKKRNGTAHICACVPPLPTLSDSSKNFQNRSICLLLKDWIRNLSHGANGW
ncbi:hypothetical protein GQ55_9G376600 [Panicum hallii var. hallii]|uniref:Uncharacterized protein n=1 Tax=Panicum hallii var. hallii TaxID=1504633 RepID=A0A2T7C954_9POAL|nr:hypothetical protein GQ55_9G376600 [Panicum hallii var. hallii]